MPNPRIGLLYPRPITHVPARPHASVKVGVQPSRVVPSHQTGRAEGPPRLDEGEGVATPSQTLWRKTQIGGERGPRRDDSI